MNSSTNTPKNSSKGIPILSSGYGRSVVGTVEPDGTYCKTIHTQHILRTPPAIAFNESELASAVAAGAVRVRVKNADTGEVYRAEISTIYDKGFSVARGWGKQTALLLDSFSVVASGVATKGGRKKAGGGKPAKPAAVFHQLRFDVGRVKHD